MMNVLFVLPYCHVPDIDEGSSTGFGIYTIQLAEELAKKQDMQVYVLSMKQRFLKDVVHNGVTYIGVSDIKICVRALKKSSIENAREIYRYNYYNISPFKKVATAVYSAAKTTLLDEIVLNYSIDIIHIHSLAQELYGVFKSEQISQTNTLVTLHNDFVKEEKYKKYSNYFKNTVKVLFKANIPISFVSTGVKENFVEEMGFSSQNLSVIVNGTRLKTQDEKREKKNGKFRFVCVGTIGSQKNQLFLLKAVTLLPENIRQKIHIDFLGMDKTDGEFDKTIRTYGLSSICKNCGFISPDKIGDFLSDADGNVMVSLGEAFGLSVIEGFQYGIPTLTYVDVCASKDFFSKDAVMLINRSNPKALADAMCEFISKDWNRDRIKEWGRKFQLSGISDMYIDLYKKIRMAEHGSK